MQSGNKVRYIPFEGCDPSSYENGIVKSIDGNHAFVVYHCNGDWDNYHNYTAERTPISSLELGWI